MSGLIPQRFIEDLLDRTDLAELIGSRITLKKAGANYKARCPFHDEKTPSFNVRPDKGFYHCFGCGAHGDAISFVREFEGLDFTAAVEELARRAGLEVPYDKAASQQIRQARTLTDALDFASEFYHNRLNASEGTLARNYLAERGLDQKIIELYQLGFAPGAGTALYNAAGDELRGPLIETGNISDRYGKPRDLFRNRVMFPIRNTRGRTVAFGGRTLGDDKAKYINSPESDVFHKSREIYGLFEARQALRQIDKLLVVEGYMDVIALAQYGIHYAVAAMGTATNQDSLGALLKQTRHLVFCFDGDTAGYRAADRAMENALELLADGIHMQFLMLPKDEDPDTLVRKEGPEAFEKRIQGATPLSRYLFDRMQEGLNLELPEHRGELRSRAEPLLNRMPKGTLRDAMWHEMMRLCRPPRGTWEEGRGGRQWSGPRRQGRGAGTGVPAQREPVRLSRNHMLCLAMLEAPDLAPELSELCRQDRQLDTAARFAQWLGERQLKNRRQILHHLARAPEEQARFQGIFDGIEHLPSREDALDSARELLAPNEEAMRKQRLKALAEKARDLNFADMTPEERQRLKASLTDHQGKHG
ncbi:DNA primase [Marinobacter daqiaonensis]|uniref:DNA primase n=1 Tax=Marinobacter daqiaonensis TaxID=650891 RepID=A0A1I6JW36_9GAMM|nr:DNA primase [Marinobacter daqiaonensis]SFR83131.1 DNA primase [Marinobacter daqiaonensis]